MVTDTVCCPASLTAEIPHLEVVPSAELSAKVISTIMTNSSMGKILGTFNAADYLKTPNLFNSSHAQG
jgi:ribose-phosphate pyrophosphokinase